MNLSEQVLIGFIGRPILTVIKWLRWYLFLGGLIFNTVEVYDPVSKSIVSSHLTVIPFIFGLSMLAIGLTVKRYDENMDTFNNITEVSPLVKNKKTNQKFSNKPTTYEDDYQDLLADLAEARQAANRARAERFVDDSSSFNPRLSESEAYWVIKQAAMANEAEEKKHKEQSSKILKPLSSEESLLATNKAMLLSVSNPDPHFKQVADKISKKVTKKSKILHLPKK